MLLIISSVIVARIFLSVVNIIHKPKEGIFERQNTDKDYCYWSLRAVIRKWPLWLTRQLNLPLLENFAIKVLGNKTFNSSCVNGGWIDCEFIEFGKNVKIGQGSVVMSNILIKDKLIIKKVVLSDNVIIGAHSVVSPGTVIEKNAHLSALSRTRLNQNLYNNLIYRGRPAKQIYQNEFHLHKIKLEKAIFQDKREITDESQLLHMETKEMTVPFHVYISSGLLIVGGSFIIPALLFFIFLYKILIPKLFLTPFFFWRLSDWNVMLLLLITPLILISIYLLHLFFVALFTSGFYRFADYRGPAQGIFDRNLNEHWKALDYYHWRSFLLKYPIFIFLRSPFPWLLNWELRFIGSNRVGKGTIFEECFIHSHLNFGRNCYMGTFAHISNHMVDGVYGSENLTFYGAKIGDNCIFNALMGGMPGLEVGNNATFLPMATSIKYDKIEGDGIYSGFPVVKVKNDKIENLIYERKYKQSHEVLQKHESIDLKKIPITTNVFSWSPFSIFLYLLLHILSFLIPSLMILTFYTSALRSNVVSNWWRLIFIILDVMAWWGLYLLFSLLLGKLFLIILELIHKPKQGLFRLDKHDKDYSFYCLRTSVKKFIFWTWNNFAFPWVSNFAFKVCKMKADFKSTMFDGWSDLEFIEYGKNVMIGQGAVVLSSMIIGDHLLIKKVIIGDHVVIGGNSIVAPGTIIGKGATLGVWASTHINQILEPDWIYISSPARKFKSSKKNYEESKIESEKGTLRRIVDSGEKVPHTVKRYVMKDMVALAIDNLDTLYQKWLDDEKKKKDKNLRKKYKSNKKQIKKQERESLN
jgi:acetyltransferase-like isoleucine patch superfamily enzyme